MEKIPIKKPEALLRYRPKKGVLLKKSVETAYPIIIPNIKSMTSSILGKTVRLLLQPKRQNERFKKLALIGALVFGLLISIPGIAQNVSINRSNVPLKTIFKDIKKQTGYSFFYNTQLLQSVGNVSISMSNVPMEKVLEACFKNQPFEYSIVDKTVVIKPKKAAPEATIKEATEQALIEVTGKVLDKATGKPVAGASVLSKSTTGPSAGTATDGQGNFTLKVKEKAPLEISSVGFETLKAEALKGFLTINLKEKIEAALADAVVTGYQQINRESFTGTAITVSGEDLKKVNPQNILRSLQTFDPSFKIQENNLLGSNPNRLPSITVRGSTALPGGTSDAISRTNLAGTANLPTFILDGYEVSLQKVYDLDINRVKSVTLLKDAAATAVYGSRAANGVMIIVTKPPKSGQLQLSYNYETNVTAPDLSQYKVLNAEQKLEYELLAGLYDADKNQAVSQEELDEIYYHKKALVVGGVNTDWLAQPLRTTFGQKHSLFVEGGEEAIRYSLGLRYQTMPGVMKGSTRDRYSTDLALAYSPSSKFQFRNTLSVTMMNAKESPYGNFGDYVRANPYYPKTDSMGRILQEVDRWTDRRNGGVNSYPTLNPMYNSTLGGFDKTDYLEIIDALNMEWSITPALRLRSVISLNQTKSTGNRFTSPFNNVYYESTDIRVGERGSYNYSNRDETTVDGTLSLTYNKQIGKSFLNVILASNIRTYLSKYKEVEAIGFTNDRFTDIGFASSYAKKSTPYSNVQKDRLAGAFVSVNYSYNNKYLLDATFREDGSSKFGSEKKIAPFGALGLGWNLHKEMFLEHTLISRLKLRVSAGFTGSVSFDSYMAKTTYRYDSDDQYSTGIGAIVSNYGNDRLQWQKTRNTDIGLELGLLKDRLIIMPRYYNKLTQGLVADVSLAPSTGFSSYKENVGNMRNEGYELNLNAVVLRSHGWNLNVYANMVRNTNTIVKVSNSLKAYNDKVDQAQDDDTYKGAPLTRYKEGQSVDALYAVRSLGIDPENGRELYVKKDGKTLTYEWDVRDIVPVGVSTPKAEGYFGINTNYKQFGLNLSFYSRFGGDQYNQTLVDRVENADVHYNVDLRVFEEKWKNRGDRVFYKNIADLGRTDVSSRFIQKDNIIDLQSLFFSYDVSQQIYSKIKAKNMRFSFTMNDVWRWSSIKQERGIDYPYARSFTFSLQAGF